MRSPEHPRQRPTLSAGACFGFNNPSPTFEGEEYGHELLPSAAASVALARVDRDQPL